jgi:hypothetical protein
MIDEPEELVAFIEEHGGYWDGEVPDATVAAWKYEVANNDTRLSYWEWAYNEIEGET